MRPQLARPGIVCHLARRLKSTRSVARAAKSRHDVPAFPSFQDAPLAASARPKDRPRIGYISGEGGASQDRLAFFAEPGESDGLAGGDITPADEIAGIESGRVVEVRRSGGAHIGLILSPISVAGRARLLLLRPTGEIWPVGPADVQFVMPASLIPAATSAACWSPELLELWARGQDIGLLLSAESTMADTIGAERAHEMTTARRKVASILRRVQRETERMRARLIGGSLRTGKGGGIEAIYDAFAPQDPARRGSLSTTEAAEYLLNAEDAGTPGGPAPIIVRPHTLPAFAAHTILMSRADLFLGAERDMHLSGQFLVRSREQRDMLEFVTRAIENEDSSLADFVAKGIAVRNALQRIAAGDDVQVPQWSQTDLHYVRFLALAQFETRSIQPSPALLMSPTIVKAFGLYPEKEMVDGALVARLLVDLGITSAYDSLRASMLTEAAARAADLVGVGLHAAGPFVGRAQPTPQDAALDSLRHNFSSRVYIIDDPNAEELDDGVSLERVGPDDFWVHVHVADPTRFLARDDPAALRASFFGTTSYLPEGVLYLLPPALGGGQLSLGTAGAAGQATMVFSARLDSKGNISDTKVAMGWMKGAVVTTYAEVNTALGIDMPPLRYPFGHPPDDSGAPRPSRATVALSEADKADLATLKDLAVALRANRTATAGFDWSPATSTLSLVDTPRPPHDFFSPAHSLRPQLFRPGADDLHYRYVAHGLPPPTTSQSVVAELMMLANRVAAGFCAARGIAGPFRGSEAPRNTGATPAGFRVEDLLAMRLPGTGILDPSALNRSNVLIPMSAVSTAPLPHWIMGFAAADHGYLRATSPLRRFDDLLVHWQIKAALAADARLPAPPPLAAPAVAELIVRSDHAQRRAKYAALAAERFWRAGLFAQRATGPLPAGYTIDPAHAVDLADVEAVVASAPTVMESGPSPVARSTLFIPSLAAMVDIVVPPSSTFDIGEQVNARFLSTTQWPNPIINFTKV